MGGERARDPSGPVVHVVGRDWSLRALLRGELRERGVEALGFESAADSLEAAAARPPAAAVLDARGLDAAALRDAAARLPDVALLVVLPRGRAEEARAAGLREPVFLPVSLGALAGRVLALLGRRAPASRG